MAMVVQFVVKPNPGSDLAGVIEQAKESAVSLAEVRWESEILVRHRGRDREFRFLGKLRNLFSLRRGR